MFIVTVRFNMNSINTNNMPAYAINIITSNVMLEHLISCDPKIVRKVFWVAATEKVSPMKLTLYIGKPEPIIILPNFLKNTT